MGGTLVIVGIYVFIVAMASNPVGLPTDFTRGGTWLLWALFIAPISLGSWLLVGERRKGD